MALAIHTDIYKAASQLLNSVADPLVTMPRNARAVFGLPLRDLLMRNLDLITDANKAVNDEKVPPLDELLRCVRQEEVLIRLFHDKRWMSHGQYAAAIQHSSSVGRQANGLRKKYAPAT